ncbi:unnamed protein product [Lasius platythorax]|uniref:Uncharacterized protein n=1 Tax=Lasius platythorax TaxID=488582 RepID=A0AAV2NEQ1_9HYME
MNIENLFINENILLDEDSSDDDNEEEEVMGFILHDLQGQENDLEVLHALENAGEIFHEMFYRERQNDEIVNLRLLHTRLPSPPDLCDSVTPGKIMN